MQRTNWVIARWEGDGRMGKKVEGIKKNTRKQQLENGHGAVKCRTRNPANSVHF